MKLVNEINETLKNEIAERDKPQKWKRKSDADKELVKLYTSWDKLSAQVFNDYDSDDYSDKEVKAAEKREKQLDDLTKKIKSAEKKI